MEANIRRAKEAYAARDFDALARVIVHESNQLHAICLDTEPPLFYMNALSQCVVRLCEAFNACYGSGKRCVAYSFDAGPNAFLFMEEHHVDKLVHWIKQLFTVKY